MKLISLNTWGGTTFDPLMEFIRREAHDTDIFCLQEIFHTESDTIHIGRSAQANLFTELSAALPGHVGYFDSCQDGLEPGGVSAGYHLQFGLSTFIRKDIAVARNGVTFVHRGLNACVENDLRTMGRNAQYFELTHDNIAYGVVNFHGLWNGQGKSDSEDRLEQSRKLYECVNSISGKKILCGDFNLLPDTESIKIASEGLRNLITEYDITSTRSSLYDKSIKFADYIFVSPDIEVESFRVYPDEISDHLALGLDFQ
jgi:endonuclease/exonuclease/phosphatase family metal-dependent hydrolase